jgi:hypothetical protein
VRPTWTPSGGAANWTSTGNWDWQIAPNFRDADAQFGNTVATPQFINVDAPVTVGSITFDSAQAHTINSTGSGAITFDTYTGDGRIDSLAGTHTINAPVTLLRPLTVNAAAGATVKLLGSMTANGQAITKTGDGVAELRNVRTGSLAVNAGTLRIADSGGAASGVSKFGALNIAASARIDLRDNKLITYHTDRHIQRRCIWRCAGAGATRVQLRRVGSARA